MISPGMVTRFYSLSTAVAAAINRSTNDAERAAAIDDAARLWRVWKCPPDSLPTLRPDEAFRVLDCGITLIALPWVLVDAEGEPSIDAASPAGQTERAASSGVPLAQLMRQVGVPDQHAVALCAALAEAQQQQPPPPTHGIELPALEEAARAAKLRVGDRFRLMHAAARTNGDGRIIVA
eukprot:745454-Prymnesium_polylepis.1